MHYHAWLGDRSSSSCSAQHPSHLRHGGLSSARSSSASSPRQRSRTRSVTEEAVSPSAAPEVPSALPYLLGFWTEFGDTRVPLERLLHESIVTLRDFAYGMDVDDFYTWPNSDAWLQMHAKANRILDAAAVAKGRLRFAQQASLPAAAAHVCPHLVANVRAEGRLREAVDVPVAANCRPAERSVPSESSRAQCLAANLVGLLFDNLHFSSKGGPHQACSPELAEQAKGLLLAKYATYSPDTLRNALSSWRRWTSWCLARQPRQAILPTRSVPAAAFLHAVQHGHGQWAQVLA